MIIAINTRFMFSGNQEGHGIFINETFSRIAKQHPEHEFIYIFDQPFDEKFITSENIKPIVAGPVAKYPLLWKYWYDIKIPSILKKIKAAVFVSCDGFCSLKTNVPQCLVIHNLDFLNQPTYIKKSHTAYIRKYMSRFLAKAKTVFTCSNYLKKEIDENYKIEDSKIVVGNSSGREIFKPLLTDEKIGIKNKYTEGKEYFIYSGTMNAGKNLLGLLKAFSIFKKRQQTSMKLILVGSFDANFESFKKDLQSYKYRSDVLLIESPDESELVKLVAAAYGFVTASLIEEFPIASIEAIMSDVPVIAFETNTMKEIVKDAALFADEITHDSMANKMMLLYKDESLRNDLIIKGRKVTADYSWDQTAESVWQCIVKTME